MQGGGGLDVDSNLDTDCRSGGLVSKSAFTVALIPTGTVRWTPESSRIEGNIEVRFPVLPVFIPSLFCL